MFLTEEAFETILPAVLNECEYKMITNLITDLSQNRWLQFHTLEQCPHNATLLPCLEITQLPEKHI